jgi:hypothetical protein
MMFRFRTVGCRAAAVSLASATLLTSAPAWGLEHTIIVNPDANPSIDVDYRPMTTFIGGEETGRELLVQLEGAFSVPTMDENAYSLKSVTVSLTGVMAASGWAIPFDTSVYASAQTTASIKYLGSVYDYYNTSIVGTSVNTPGLVGVSTGTALSVGTLETGLGASWFRSSAGEHVTIGFNMTGRAQNRLDIDPLPNLEGTFVYLHNPQLHVTYEYDPIVSLRSNGMAAAFNLPTAGEGVPISLTYLYGDPASVPQSIVDDLAPFVQVPEPGSGLLLMGALCGALMRRRRC